MITYPAALYPAQFYPQIEIISVFPADIDHTTVAVSPLQYSVTAQDHHTLTCAEPIRTITTEVDPD